MVSAGDVDDRREDPHVQGPELAADSAQRLCVQLACVWGDAALVLRGPVFGRRARVRAGEVCRNLSRKEHHCRSAAGQGHVRHVRLHGAWRAVRGHELRGRQGPAPAPHAPLPQARQQPSGRVRGRRAQQARDGQSRGDRGHVPHGRVLTHGGGGDRVAATGATRHGVWRAASLAAFEGGARQPAVASEARDRHATTRELHRVVGATAPEPAAADAAGVRLVVAYRDRADAVAGEPRGESGGRGQGAARAAAREQPSHARGRRQDGVGVVGVGHAQGARQERRAAQEEPQQRSAGADGSSAPGADARQAARAQGQCTYHPDRVRR
mmetsp:Transcript_3668/g.8838  ORF Transcript_3668/g.8838 Transcript_3668/m.8838 type:complete len:325 (+) Transcript_3668:1331-2305(+)